VRSDQLCGVAVAELTGAADAAAAHHMVLVAARQASGEYRAAAWI